MCPYNFPEFVEFQNLFSRKKRWLNLTNSPFKSTSQNCCYEYVNFIQDIDHDPLIRMYIRM